MNGVPIPGVSAGSNQVGASEMCTAQVICPSGAAAPGATAPRREQNERGPPCHRGSRIRSGSVRPQTTASTVAPFFVVTVCTHPFGR